MMGLLQKVDVTLQGYIAGMIKSINDSDDGTIIMLAWTWISNIFEFEIENNSVLLSSAGCTTIQDVCIYNYLLY